MLSWPSKDPNEILDYQLDWTKALATDTILSSQWTVPDGITMSAQEFAPTTTTIWLTGGEEGVSYVLTNRIVTAGERTMDQSVKLRIRSK